MSHPDCPRQMSFTLAGVPGVRITATEVSGTIQFVVDVTNSAISTGDLRALFFHINEAELTGLTVTGDSWMTDSKVLANKVIDLGDGANLSGKVKTGFDVGTEWGTPGGKKDDISFPVTFTISNGTGDLTLDDLGGKLFGAKLDSVGGPGGPRGSTAKLIGYAPYAPNAQDDTVTMFEDGASGLDDPSKSPLAVTINVLGNDTDVDTAANALRIDHIVVDPLHGTITTDGLFIYYTPELDYSGSDSFWYCMTDGTGGQDSAEVTITITAVADRATFAFSIAQGTTINDTLITVTATQNDADNSEILSSLSWAAASLPLGASITPTGPILGTGLSISQQFLVSTAAGEDWDFDVDFIAVSTDGADTQSETSTREFKGNSEALDTSLTYAVNDQSIWSTGNAFHYELSGSDGFFGINIPEESGGDVYTVLGVDLAGWSYAYQLTAGFQLEVEMDGGGIDASIPIDVSIDSTYNHTTDAIYIDSSMALGSGGSFSTYGPEGSLSLDFIFTYLLSFSAWSDLLASFTVGPYSGDYSQNIIDLDTSDPAYEWPLLPGIVSLIAEWPHINVSNDAGTMSGSAFSNYMLALNLDVDALANALLGGALSWIDADQTTEDNFEVLDIDLVGGLRLLQEFVIGLTSGQAVTLVLEDGTTMPMTIGTGLWINNASDHDLDENGIVNFSFALDPDVQLTNSTSIDLALSAQLAFFRNVDLLVTEITIYEDNDIPIANLPIEIFNETFALNGVGSQNVDFWV